MNTPTRYERAAHRIIEDVRWPLTKDGDQKSVIVEILEAYFDDLAAALRPFAFLNAPEKFLSDDGGCTEAIIEDADVHNAREALRGCGITPWRHVQEPTQ